MKTFILYLICLMLYIPVSHAQFLNKLKQKVEQAVDKTVDKVVDKTVNKADKKISSDDTGSGDLSKASASSIKVYSKFDFVPGNTILYYDNFEKDNIGETPDGWLTTNMAEVVQIDGLEGNWITLNAKGGAINIIRNKKQSWGDNFTIEFDIFRDPSPSTYGSDLYIILANSKGKMVTDETLLNNGLYNTDAIMLAAGIDKSGQVYRLTIGKNMGSNSAGGSKFSDQQGLELAITSPVHISMAATGKRLRMWWNSVKIMDVNSAINPDAVPNILGFSSHPNVNTTYYLGNIRIARDVPDTRAEFEEGKVISNLLFFSGSAKMRPESMGSLYDVSKVIKEASDNVKIVGHTDSDGDESLNQKLSEQRAETVKDILVKEYGIDASKLTSEGRGESQPVADNNSAEGKAQNRRVEFIFKDEADNYSQPLTQATSADINNVAKNKETKSEASGLNNAPGSLAIQSTILNTSLPYSQIIRGEKDNFVLLASKEEGNSKENFLKITFKPVAGKLAPGTYNFKENNQKNPMFGTKDLPEIVETEAVIHFGNASKPFISSFVPYISTKHESEYYKDIGFYPPTPSDKCKLVIESVKDGKASGYFVMGIRTEGNKAVVVGDVLTRTITGKYEGEIKGDFKSIPIY